MKQRGWGALSAKEGGGVIPHGTVNKQAGLRRQQWRIPPSNLGVGKLVRVS
jgi:hypothetical protein